MPQQILNFSYPYSISTLLPDSHQIPSLPLSTIQFSYPTSLSISSSSNQSSAVPPFTFHLNYTYHYCPINYQHWAAQYLHHLALSGSLLNLIAFNILRSLIQPGYPCPRRQRIGVAWVELFAFIAFVCLFLLFGLSYFNKSSLIILSNCPSYLITCSLPSPLILSYSHCPLHVHSLLPLPPLYPAH